MADKNYLCIEAVSSGSEFYIADRSWASGTKPTLYYSTNNGSSWSLYSYNTRISLNAGGKCYWRGTNSTFNNQLGNVNFFDDFGSKYKVSGNIMSLVDQTVSSLTIPSEYCFSKLFNNFGVISLPLLPATTLKLGCYYGLFEVCQMLKVSETKTGKYVTEFRIPSTGTISSVPDVALSRMFTMTGGTFKSTPSVNTTYYVYDENAPVTKTENLYSGSSKIGTVTFGSSNIAKVYYGNTLIFGEE